MTWSMKILKIDMQLIRKMIHNGMWDKYMSVLPGTKVYTIMIWLIINFKFN